MKLFKRYWHEFVGFVIGSAGALTIGVFLGLHRW